MRPRPTVTRTAASPFGSRPSGLACLAALLLAALLLAACSDDTAPKSDATVKADATRSDAGENLNAEGCEHLKGGPFVDVTAASDAAGAPEVKADHKAYRVILPGSGAGQVKYLADAAGDVNLFLDADVPLAVEDDKKAAVAIEKSEKSIPECAEIKGRHTVPLSAVGTYVFKLGPGAAKVTVVIEEAGHSHGS